VEKWKNNKFIDLGNQNQYPIPSYQYPLASINQNPRRSRSVAATNIEIF
jgi:hypothetical protein